MSNDYTSRVFDDSTKQFDELRATMAELEKAADKAQKEHEAMLSVITCSAVDSGDIQASIVSSHVYDSNSNFLHINGNGTTWPQTFPGTITPDISIDLGPSELEDVELVNGELMGMVDGEQVKVDVSLISMAHARMNALVEIAMSGELDEDQTAEFWALKKLIKIQMESLENAMEMAEIVEATVFSL